MEKQPCPEVEHQLFSGVTSEERGNEVQKLHQDCDQQKQASHGGEGISRGVLCPVGKYCGQDTGERVRADNAIDGDLQRNRREYAEWSGYQAEYQQSGQMPPVRTGLRQYS